jgi:CheY-like chemotaxis protein
MENKSLLIVDDEPMVLHALQAILLREGYQVFTASSGEEGLSLLEKQRIQVILSDLKMPKMNGIEFFEKVIELYPETVRVILSGQMDLCDILDAINKSQIYRYLNKPWNNEEVKTTVRQCFEYHEVTAKNNLMMQEVMVKKETLEKWAIHLEEMVAQRSWVMELSKRILKKLPFPLVGLDSLGQMILANERCRKVFSFPEKQEDILPGVLFTQAIQETIQRVCQGKETEIIMTGDMQGKKMQIHIKRIRKEPFGCLVLMKELVS